MNLPLFADLPVNPRAHHVQRDGWIAHYGTGLPGRAGLWTHPGLPDVEVRHCGHPTALRPYYIRSDCGGAKRKFRHLKEAQLYALAWGGADSPADRAENEEWRRNHA